MSCFQFSVFIRNIFFFFSEEKKDTKAARTLRQTMTVSFLSPCEFMCDCSTIWSRSIYSWLPTRPPSPCILKVTPGDFGRGVLELPCQCEALQLQVYWWDQSLWGRTAPVPSPKHKAAFYAFSKHTGCKYIHSSGCMPIRAEINTDMHASEYKLVNS